MVVGVDASMSSCRGRRHYIAVSPPRRLIAVSSSFHLDIIAAFP